MRISEIVFLSKVSNLISNLTLFSPTLLGMLKSPGAGLPRPPDALSFMIDASVCDIVTISEAISFTAAGDPGMIAFVPGGETRADTEL